MEVRKAYGSMNKNLLPLKRGSLLNASWMLYLICPSTVLRWTFVFTVAPQFTTAWITISAVILRVTCACWFAECMNVSWESWRRCFILSERKRVVILLLSNIIFAAIETVKCCFKMLQWIPSNHQNNPRVAKVMLIKSYPRPSFSVQRQQYSIEPRGFCTPCMLTQDQMWRFMELIRAQ